MNLKALKEQRNGLVEKLKNIQLSAEMDKRSLNDNESMLFDLVEKEIRELDEQIQGSIKPIERKEYKGMHSKEYRSAEDQLNNELRGLDGTGTATGGVTIPTILSADIVKDIEEVSDVYADCKRVNYKGKYKQIKRKSSNAVGWTKEFQDVLRSKAEYDGIIIEQHKISGLDTISLELWAESQFNIVEEVKGNFIDDLAVKVENSIFHGDGENKPTGLLNGIELTAEDLTADLLIDMITGIKKKYLSKAKFYISRKTLAKVRKLKDLEGRYIFDTTNNKILGYDYAITEALEDEIIFGSFHHGYLLNVNNEMMLNVLKEKFIDQGAYGVVLHAFIGGKVIDENAFVINKISA